MKIFIKSLFSVTFLTLAMTSCLNNSDVVTEDTLITYDFELNASEYTPDGVSVNAYNPDAGALYISYPSPGVLFSHKAEVTEYDGVEYKSFTGFVPSKVDDQTDHSGDDWTLYQFSAIAPSYGVGFLVAHWDVRENENTKLEERSCIMDFVYSVKPVKISITNSSYAYWVMKNGSAFSKPFTDDSYLALDIYGVSNFKETYFDTVYLYKDGKYIDTWQSIDLTGMGEVNQIYFTMRSSDSGEWGMNTPAYFALGSVQVLYPGTKN